MRKKSDYMILSLLGASGLIPIISVCFIAAGCGNTAGTNIQGTEPDAYLQETEPGTYAQEPEKESGTREGASEETLEAPPSLEVVYVGDGDAAVPSEKDGNHNTLSENRVNGNSITLSFGNGSWETREDGDMGVAAVYCGAHPLDMNYESVTIQLDPEQSLHVLELNFEVKPDSWEVVSVWRAEDAGDTDAYENGMTYDSTVDFKDDSYMAAWAGDYIYEIKAVWDRETYGGEAYYCFRAVCSQTE